MTRPSRARSGQKGQESALNRVGAKAPTGALPPPDVPRQTVLVLQGGGALGAYQVGVYQALHEHGIEPDWVIGTSIGAINAALIAGNPADRRLAQLHAFWDRIGGSATAEPLPLFPGQSAWWSNWVTVARGIPHFFVPNPAAWGGVQAEVGVEAASYYSTAPLHDTLTDLVDLRHLDARGTRLTVGAVSVRTGHMHYFDSRDAPIRMEHVMASGALPPAFPAIRIDGEAYWDGGLYSNTPIEAVLDDNPRRDSLIFAVNVWHPTGPEPRSIWEVLGRQKDIQYASRAESHIARQQQIHHLRHVIRDLARRIPPESRSAPEVRELASWGCGTTMHVVHLLAPRLAHEDHTKDIDFTADGVQARWQAGYTDARRALELRPWNDPVDPRQGVIVHDVPR